MIATSVGSLPASDSFLEATRVVAGELSLPHLVELPGLGPGADMVGRTGYLLSTVSSDLSWETTPTGWRHSSAGRVMRRAGSWWNESCDALEQVLDGYRGPVKVQVCGAWTFASAVESVRGERLLADPGFVRDVSAALHSAIAVHVTDIRTRIPGADVIIQVDEPGLAAVLAGSVPTASGFGRIAPIDVHLMRDNFRDLVENIHAMGAQVAVHSCAASAPWAMLSSVGADILSGTAESLGEAVGEHVDSGRSAWLATVPTSPPASSAADVGEVAARRSEQLRRRLGFAESVWAERTAVTPECGLGASSQSWARAALVATREAARVLSGAQMSETGEA